MISYEEMLKGIRRARETETRIRALDVDDIVTEIHGLEDRIEQLIEAGREYMRLNDRGQYRDSGGFDPGLSHSGEVFEKVLNGE